jgi:hypothetical protein
MQSDEIRPTWVTRLNAGFWPESFLYLVAVGGIILSNLEVTSKMAEASTNIAVGSLKRILLPVDVENYPSGQYLLVLLTCGPRGNAVAKGSE